jgi:3-hydroxyisobutyrate dehydrogenase-like beta-hydroxyacid dehydrogenase
MITNDDVVVAVLGLGEAGSRYAADLLAAGAAVVGYDPVARPGLPGLRQVDRPAGAVRAAHVVLSLNAAHVAERVASDAAPGLRPGTVFADLNTSAPEVKRRVAATVEPAGAAFVDVAVLAPVPRRGLRTPVAVAGPGRERLADFLASFGAPVEDAGPEPGAAAGRKLLRSVFMKGLAAVLLESLEIAGLAGQEDWVREQIVGEFTAADRAFVDRLVEGTPVHARRRLDEMRAAAAYAADLGARHDMTRATIAGLARLVASSKAPDTKAPDTPDAEPGGAHPTDAEREEQRP